MLQRGAKLLPNSRLWISGRDCSNRGRAGGIVRIGLRDEVVADLDSLADPVAAGDGLRDERRRGVQPIQQFLILNFFLPFWLEVAGGLANEVGLLLLLLVLDLDLVLLLLAVVDRGKTRSGGGGVLRDERSGI